MTTNSKFKFLQQQLIMHFKNCCETNLLYSQGFKKNKKTPSVSPHALSLQFLPEISPIPYSLEDKVLYNSSHLTCRRNGVNEMHLFCGALKDLTDLHLNTVKYSMRTHFYNFIVVQLRII